jgi:hypothetical protein
MTRGTKDRRMREQPTMASLNNACILCARQCRVIATVCLRLQSDPNYHRRLGDDASRLASMAKLLLEESGNLQGAQILRLAVTRRLLMQVMARKEVVVWLARNHREALTILMGAIDFEDFDRTEFVDSPPPLSMLQRLNCSDNVKDSP